MLTGDQLLLLAAATVLGSCSGLGVLLWQCNGSGYPTKARAVGWAIVAGSVAGIAACFTLDKLTPPQVLGIAAACGLAPDITIGLIRKRLGRANRDDSQHDSG